MTKRIDITVEQAHFLRGIGEEVFYSSKMRPFDNTTKFPYNLAGLSTRIAVDAATRKGEYTLFVEVEE